MKRIPTVIAIIAVCLLFACAGALEGGRSFRSGKAESVGFHSERLARIDTIVVNAIRDSAFPGAQLCIVKGGVVVYNRSFGRLTYDPNAPVTSLQTMFDLASLTKVIATTSAIMKLYDQQKLSLDDKVSKFIPRFGEGKKAQITIRHLLSHTSGLPPFRQLWKFVPDARYAIDSVYATPLVANPGDTTIYSDLGFIALGNIVMAASGEPLDVYVKENFFEPLGMTRTMFKPPAERRNEIAPSEYDTLWRGHLVQGIVHDENADFLGGVSGHAGLFSTANDLAAYMLMLTNGGVYGGRRYLDSSTIALFTKKQSPWSTRALGWDTKTMVGGWAGSLTSPNAFGHTGFTGTSICVEPERHLFLILLTNRVYPTRANMKIFRIRSAVADAVMEALN